MYIIVNLDLKMSSGKIASQVGHAVSKMIRNNIKSPIIRSWVDKGEAKIVLKSTEKELYQILDKYPKITYGIYDAGITQVKGDSLTCVGLIPIGEHEVPLDILRLKLL